MGTEDQLATERSLWQNHSDYSGDLNLVEKFHLKLWKTCGPEAALGIQLLFGLIVCSSILLILLCSVVDLSNYLQFDFCQASQAQLGEYTEQN